MADLVTVQELFDGQAHFSPADVAIILDFQDLWRKHTGNGDLTDWPASYYNDLSDLAHKHGVMYTAPSHIGKLTGVGSTTTVH